MAVKYKIRFWFEHGGFCLWGANDAAREKYGYPIRNERLPISSSLVSELDALEDEYGTYLDWGCPQNPTSWTNEQRIEFLNKATRAFERLKLELGDDFDITNEVARSVQI